MTQQRAAVTARARSRALVARAVLPGLLVALLAAVLAWALRDELHALSALVGGLLALLTFGLGVTVMRSVIQAPATTTMAGAFGVMTLQIVVLATLLIVLRAQDWVRMPTLVMSFLTAGVVFQAGLLWASTRVRSTLDVAMPGAAR